MIQDWEFPPMSHGRIPDITRGSSDGKIVKGDFPLDQVVIERFPPGTVVHSCNRFGVSEWTVIAKIETMLANNEPKLYFLKCAEYEQGRIMLEGEFRSMTELYKVAPNLVPKPHAFGQLNVSDPPTYYFLSDFIDMSSEHPDPVQLCTKLVALHKSSVSPFNMFGFHVDVLRGNLPLQTKWNPSWQEFFVDLFRGTMFLDQKVNGDWKNLGQLVNRLLTDVVPQVLGPLEADGRSVRPSLIHGDLWQGNIGTDSKTGEVYIFDASSYYAHHEMEIAIWRPQPGSIIGSGIYVDTYLKYMDMSEPKEQFGDRHQLYSACTALHAAACHNNLSFREE
ncbi:hypothetical protein ONZ43_g873 [Nemania bipapillata]|uniref:Uncharacterized protein n=1 Tax=Nemania bipapillata TaxID=110536 RepID=A0ACC2J6H8_9PEZI|nr:hypothetical protein ONZ43_g873 [Nemania bipapillata]